MIVWVLIAILSLVLILKGKSLEEKYPLGKLLWSMFGIMCLLVILTIYCNAFTYEGTAFTMSYPKDSIQIIKGDDETKFITKDDMTFIVDNNSVVNYDAASKDQEVVELYGEKREYKPMANAIIYAMYHLHSKENINAIKVHQAAISTYNTKEE